MRLNSARNRLLAASTATTNGSGSPAFWSPRCQRRVGGRPLSRDCGDDARGSYLSAEMVAVVGNEGVTGGVYGQAAGGVHFGVGRHLNRARMALKRAEVSSADWPPDRNAIAQTEAGTGRKCHSAVASVPTWSGAHCTQVRPGSSISISRIMTPSSITC